MIRVGICDDDRDYARLVADLISRTPGLDLMWVAYAGAEVLRPERWSVIDVLLLDVRMPAPDGLTVARQLCVQPETPRILFLTSFDEKTTVRAAIENGTGGMVPKESTSEAIVQAIRSVHAGGQVFSPKSTARLFALAGERPEAVPDLTERERQILQLVAAGHSNAAIAERLYLVESTIKGFVSGLFKKFGVGSRSQLIARVHAWELDLS